MIRKKGTKPFWKTRPVNFQQRKIFETPEELWDAACEYFEWCDDNPIPEEKSSASGQAGVQRWDIEHPRPYTISGLCAFIGIITATWRSWRASREDLKEVIGVIDEIIYTNKLEGAAVGHFNAMIVSRALRLGDNLDITSAGDSLADSRTLSDEDLSKLSKKSKRELLTLMKEKREREFGDGDQDGEEDA